MSDMYVTWNSSGQEDSKEYFVHSLKILLKRWSDEMKRRKFFWLWVQISFDKYMGHFSLKSTFWYPSPQFCFA